MLYGLYISSKVEHLIYIGEYIGVCVVKGLKLWFYSKNLADVLLSTKATPIRLALIMLIHNYWIILFSSFQKLLAYYSIKCYLLFSIYSAHKYC